jgi:hypothetical protein
LFGSLGRFCLGRVSPLARRLVEKVRDHARTDLP